MANTKSAEKRNRQSHKRRARNFTVRSAVKKALKEARAVILQGTPAEAKEALRQATRSLHKAATKGVLHSRNAARRIARLAHAVAAKTAKK